MQVEAYQGDMMPYGGDFTVEGYAPCDGSLMSVNQNQALFTILGNKYGGDGRSTFATPDLRGRSPIRFGQGPGLSEYKLGQIGGIEQALLSYMNMPSHTHVAEADTKLHLAANYGNTFEPIKEDPSYFAPSNLDSDEQFFVPSGFESPELLTASKSVETQIQLKNAGGSQPFSVLSPYLAIGWQICILGAYPRRA
ncbi:tail fiber protein [Pseudoalteromonas sp. McH1-42]|uniref:phage tail protein n=1 Tax=Pseudoalteromonas sp. McH1-42 TaxID=2917752 RepID=UPI001EF6B780|nr:tail fiber protein [Pseudoalteromonas sp. McH1-42]MCG7561891.1 tail fiber protein [Pseudoalteromonas sp. McH1-42]